MNKQQAISEACSIIYMAYNSIGNFKIACDCFCGQGGKEFQTADKATFDFVREAVKEKLVREGYKVKPL